jgi:polyvinyl alcohol dehydrogenase (cytochrome)
MKNWTAHLLTSACAMCALLGWAANWPAYRHDHNNSGLADSTLQGAPRLKRAWVYRADSRITSTPSVDGDAVFAGTWKGDVLAIDARTGSLRWRFFIGANSDETYGGPRGVIGSVALSNGVAYAASGNCTLTALNEVTGRKLWQTKICSNQRNDDVYASPVAVGGLVLIGVDLFSDRPTDRGREVALDAATGKIRWSYEPAKYAGVGVGVSATPVVDDKARIAYDGTGNPLPRDNPPPGIDPGSESIIAFHLDSGKMIWAYGPVHPHDTQDDDFFASPNRINIGSQAHPRWIIGEANKDGAYYAVDAGTGKLLWRRSIPGASTSAMIIGTPAVAEGVIFVPLYEGANGSLTALRARDGVALWQQRTAGEYEAPVILGAAVFTTEVTGQLDEFASGTGKALGTWNICPPSYGRGPSAAGGALYVASGTCLTRFNAM